MDAKKIYIINGSPRKNWNTAMMCSEFAKGVENSGAEAQIIHLYDIDFKGCRSCFACKLKNGKSFGKCAYTDELKPILEKISQGDGIVFATPIYYADISGVMKSFIERLFFPYTQYDKDYTPTPPKKLKTAVIYTMNVKKETFKTYIGENNQGPIGFFERWISHIWEVPERICAFNTYQFTDYDKYAAELWDKNDKILQKQDIFPDDLKRAYNAGVNMIKELNG